MAASPWPRKSSARQWYADREARRQRLEHPAVEPVGVGEQQRRVAGAAEVVDGHDDAVGGGNPVHRAILSA